MRETGLLIIVNTPIPNLMVARPRAISTVTTLQTMVYS